MALDSMKDYRVDNETIAVSPGMTWYDVYSALEPYGRVAIGGRLKTIGVPGLTLIGGVSYFSNKYGFAMDNVVDYEVVLGNGTKITASATSHPDLFWALKGGANNFAIVTRFRLQTYSMPHISTTIQQFNETGIYDFVRASCDLVLADDDASTAAGVILTITYNVTTSRASAVILGVQEGISSPPSRFANFTAIPGTSKVHNLTTSKQWASNLDSPKQMFRYVPLLLLLLLSTYQMGELCHILTLPVSCSAIIPCTPTLRYSTPCSRLGKQQWRRSPTSRACTQPS